MTALRPGDLVVLKSGGPVMTVDTVNTDIFNDDKVTGVLCVWFVGNKLERARFDCNAIAAAPPQETLSPKTEPHPPEAAGAYKAVLDEMVTAMNDPAEGLEEERTTPSRSGRARPTSSQTSKPETASKDAADTTAPQPIN